MTELAAGTDPTRDSAFDKPSEDVANTPGFAPTPAKSRIDAMRSLSRRENSVQREEIRTAQGFLRDWYGIAYSPVLTNVSRKQLQILQEASPGADFDRHFLEELGRHHYVATLSSNDCQVGRDLKHEPLRRYCSGIQHSQLNDIEEMRETLCKQFKECDYQPERRGDIRRWLNGGPMGNDQD